MRVPVELIPGNTLTTASLEAYASADDFIKQQGVASANISSRGEGRRRQTGRTFLPGLRRRTNFKSHTDVHVESRRSIMNTIL